MSYKKVFDEEWYLTGNDLVFTWTDKLDRFIISTKIPQDNPFNQPAYKKVVKSPFTLFDSVEGHMEVHTSKSKVQRIVLERLFDSFFSDVEEKIKSL